LKVDVNFINILQTAFAPKLFTEKLQRQNEDRVKLRNRILYKKDANKLLIKLAPEFAFFLTPNSDKMAWHDKVLVKMFVLQLKW